MADPSPGGPPAPQWCITGSPTSVACLPQEKKGKSNPHKPQKQNGSGETVAVKEGHRTWGYPSEKNARVPLHLFLEERSVLGAVLYFFFRSMVATCLFKGWEQPSLFLTPGEGPELALKPGMAVTPCLWVAITILENMPEFHGRPVRLDLLFTQAAACHGSRVFGTGEGDKEIVLCKLNDCLANAFSQSASKIAQRGKVLALHVATRVRDPVGFPEPHQE